MTVEELRHSISYALSPNNNMFLIQKKMNQKINRRLIFTQTVVENTREDTKEVRRLVIKPIEVNENLTKSIEFTEESFKNIAPSLPMIGIFWKGGENIYIFFRNDSAITYCAIADVRS